MYSSCPQVQFGNSKPKEKLGEVDSLEVHASIASGCSKVIEELGEGSKGKMLPKSACIPWNISLLYFSTCLLLV
jgi:hypothetical protein